MKKRKHQQNNDIVLDLHGYTSIDAENLIYDFLDKSRTNGYKNATIITGVGLNSKDGIPVLKILTERILNEKGIDYETEDHQGFINLNF